MRVAHGEHLAGKWRVGEVAPAFELLDAWALPVTGSLGQFPVLVSLIDRDERSPDDGSSPRLVRCAFQLRMWLGRVLRWDRNVNRLPIPGCSEASVRDRLPEAERARLSSMPAAQIWFRPVYRGGREAFSELSNGTLHALMQLCWVPERDHYRGRMAFYAKTRGWHGRVYLALVAPFRHHLIYPWVIRRLRVKWREATEHENVVARD